MYAKYFPYSMFMSVIPCLTIIYDQKLMCV